ncbi:PAS domain-containing protein [Lichenibacterium ramalinae]|nr:PAS domain-containing protein [Lichenibacterium ramalinae]
MNVIELARAFLDDAPIGIVITDAQPAKPGPIILYANAAFGALTGRDVDGLIGLTPRFMQGRETRRSSLDDFARALAGGDRYHGYLTNYRGDGSKYRVEIDCRPLRGADGQVEHFLSFEREVVRRVGRPASGSAGRYEPTSVSNDLLTAPLRALGAFAVTEGPP